MTIGSTGVSGIIAGNVSLPGVGSTGGGISGIIAGNVSLFGVGSTGGGISGSFVSEPPPLFEGNPSFSVIISFGQVTGAVVGPIIIPVIGSIAIFSTLPPRFKLVELGFV